MVEDKSTKEPPHIFSPGLHLQATFLHCQFVLVVPLNFCSHSEAVQENCGLFPNHIVAKVVFCINDRRTVTVAGSEKAVASSKLETLQNAKCLSLQTLGLRLQIISLPSGAGINLQLSSIVHTLQLGPANPASHPHFSNLVANGLLEANICNEPQAKQLLYKITWKLTIFTPKSILTLTTPIITNTRI